MSAEHLEGVALRETCRLVGGVVPLWRYHRARLASAGCGADVLEAAAVDVDEPPPALPTSAAKPADRAWWDVAQRRARALGAHQALIVRDGHVIDGGSASVWAVSAGVAVTPPAPFAVAGVARALLLEALPRAGVEARVEPLPLADVLAADELFLTNAFAGAVAVRGRGGPVAAAARRVFDDVWRS